MKAYAVLMWEDTRAAALDFITARIAEKKQELQKAEEENKETARIEEELGILRSIYISLREARATEI